MKEIIYYQCENGKIPYLEWYKALDKSLRITVDKRISKIERDLYGGNKSRQNKDIELAKSYVDEFNKRMK